MMVRNKTGTKPSDIFWIIVFWLGLQPLEIMQARGRRKNESG